MHAWVAMRGGDPTAYLAGQVTLSPIPHIRREPFGMLILPLLTAVTQGWAIGWASAPYDPHWAARYPKRAAWMAAAGPAGNLLIAAGSFTLLKLGLLTGWFVPPPFANFHTLVASGAGEGLGGIATALSILLVLNVFLAVFNLLPLPPLDGSHVIVSLLPRPLAIRYASFGRYGILVVLALFFILPELAVRLGVDFNPFGWFIGGPAEWLYGLIWRMAGLP